MDVSSLTHTSHFLINNQVVIHASGLSLVAILFERRKLLFFKLEAVLFVINVSIWDSDKQLVWYFLLLRLLIKLSWQTCPTRVIKSAILSLTKQILKVTARYFIKFKCLKQVLDGSRFRWFTITPNIKSLLKSFAVWVKMLLYNQ